MLVPTFNSDTELCEFAVSLYDSGKLKKEVAEILGVNPRTLYDKLKAFGFSIYKERSKGLTDEQEASVVSLYEAGKTIGDIVNELNITIQDIRKVFKKFDIKPKTPKFYRERYANEDAFSDTDEENCAYFYGWIVSDGCYTNNSIVLSIHSKDVEVLENLKAYVGTENKISVGTQKDSRSNTVYQTCSFYFKHDAMIERLVAFGLEPRKSTKETCPEVFKFNRHFWRGMIEGDGSIAKKSNEFTLVGSESIIKDFANYCYSLFPECKPNFYVKGNLHVFSLCSKVYSKQILDELYRDCNHKLSRKYNIYLEKYYGFDACRTGQIVNW